VEEAGGIVTDMAGGKNFPAQGIVASNGLIHDNFLSYFKEN
jgi:fructose-1,6-bisphosphatase/inositol monophosphatase family enzyme